MAKAWVNPIASALTSGPVAIGVPKCKSIPLAKSNAQNTQQDSTFGGIAEVHFIKN